MKGMRSLLLAGLVIVLGVSAAAAKVNCKQVRRYAQTGRSVEDIAMTMVIDVDVVKKCLESDDQDPQPTPGTDQ